MPFFGVADTAEMGASSFKGWKPSGAVRTFQPLYLCTSNPCAPSDGISAAPVKSAAGYDVTPMTLAERDAAAQGLTDFQRYVTLKAGTEGAYTGATVNGYPHDHKGAGVWVDAISGLPLFDSKTKFDSGARGRVAVQRDPTDSLQRACRGSTQTLQVPAGRRFTRPSTLRT